jgi:hypothetical protein
VSELGTRSLAGSTLAGLGARIDELLGRQVSTRSIAIVRIGVGLIACWHLRPIAVDAVHGHTFHDHFHHPFFSALPVVPPPLFTVMVVAGTIAALTMSVGLFARASAAVTTLAVGYHLLVSTTHFHNNRAYLFAVLLCLSFAPCGRTWSLDAWWRTRWRRRRGLDPTPETMAAWPLWLLRFESSLVYAASGFSKLIDPDWFGGTVTWGRVVTKEAMLRSSVLPEFVQDILLDRSFHTVAAKLIVATELFIAGGLWWRRTRVAAIAVAIAFHVSIELSASVETFSYLAIVVLFVWADPDLRWRPLRAKIAAARWQAARSRTGA